jgi:phosphotransacetylase
MNELAASAAARESVEGRTPERPGQVLLERLIRLARARPPLGCAVVWPDEDTALAAAVQAHREGLIVARLIGPTGRLHERAGRLGLDLQGIEWVDADSPVQALGQALAQARTGEIASLMKGHLHTEMLLAAILDREHGLRLPGRRISHVFVIETPGLGRLLFVSDAAVHIAPDLAAKRAIMVNAIELARACGIETPRVAILAAVETVNPKMPATVDAAALTRMAREGLIPGRALIDGPLAMDNAVDAQAARVKGLDSPVAGRADVLIVPDIEAGNLVAKTLVFLAHAGTAGLLVGARVPVMLTSRADGELARRASCALARLLLDAQGRNGV